MHPLIDLSDEVADALAHGRPIVALESTIFSGMGLPQPHSRSALSRCDAVIRRQGAVPAMTAVLRGRWAVGVEADDLDLVFEATRKVAERDLPVAAAQRWTSGATTVSATTALAHLAGIKVFATGGIGGVHRGSEISGDISADLDALALHPVITVCAGAKAFLDLPRTLEYLETAGVPVLGWQHDWFPAFYTRSSGERVAHRVEDAGEVARVLLNRIRPDVGVLLSVPIPVADELDGNSINESIEQALADCAAAGIVGAKVTPFVLERMAAVTVGESITANLALAENNARVAALIALQFGPSGSASAEPHREGSRQRLRGSGGAPAGAVASLLGTKVSAPRTEQTSTGGPTMPTTTHAGRALIVSITDQLVHGEGDDGAGALVTELLTEAGFVVDGSVAVPSDAVDIRNALNTAVIGGVDLVVTVGGTGVAPRDVTPDVTGEVLDRELPGIAQALRWSGMAAGVVDAVVSRGLVGVSGSTMVANVAGSRQAIRDGLATLIPLAVHVIGELSDPEI